MNMLTAIFQSASKPTPGSIDIANFCNDDTMVVLENQRLDFQTSKWSFKYLLWSDPKRFLSSQGASDTFPLLTPRSGWEYVGTWEVDVDYVKNAIDGPHLASEPEVEEWVYSSSFDEIKIGNFTANIQGSSKVRQRKYVRRLAKIEAVTSVVNQVNCGEQQLRTEIGALEIFGASKKIFSSLSTKALLQREDNSIASVNNKSNSISSKHDSFSDSATTDNPVNTSSEFATHLERSFTPIADDGQSVCDVNIDNFDTSSIYGSNICEYFDDEDNELSEATKDDVSNNKEANDGTNNGIIEDGKCEQFYNDVNIDDKASVAETSDNLISAEVSSTASVDATTTTATRKGSASSAFLGLFRRTNSINSVVAAAPANNFSPTSITASTPPVNNSSTPVKSLLASSTTPLTDPISVDTSFSAGTDKNMFSPDLQQQHQKKKKTDSMKATDKENAILLEQQERKIQLQLLHKQPLVSDPVWKVANHVALIELGKQLRHMESECKKEQEDRSKVWRNTVKLVIEADIAALEKDCAQIVMQLDRESVVGNNAALLHELNRVLKEKTDCLDCKKREVYLPDSDFTFGQGGVYLGINDFWLQYASGQFELQFIPDKQAPRITLKLSGTKNDPTAGVRLKFQTEGFKLAGDKGKNVPKLQFSSLGITLALSLNMNIGFDIKTLKWLLPSKAFELKILSFKGPYGINRSVVGVVLSLLTPMLRSMIVKNIPHELGMLLHSFPAPFCMRGDFNIHGIDIAELNTDLAKCEVFSQLSAYTPAQLDMFVWLQRSMDRNTLIKSIADLISYRKKFSVNTDRWLDILNTWTLACHTYCGHVIAAKVNQLVSIGEGHINPLDLTFQFDVLLTASLNISRKRVSVAFNLHHVDGQMSLNMLHCFIFQMQHRLASDALAAIASNTTAIPATATANNPNTSATSSSSSTNTTTTAPATAGLQRMRITTFLSALQTQYEQGLAFLQVMCQNFDFMNATVLAELRSGPNGRCLMQATDLVAQAPIVVNMNLFQDKNIGSLPLVPFILSIQPQDSGDICIDMYHFNHHMPLPGEETLVSDSDETFDQYNNIDSIYNTYPANLTSPVTTTTTPKKKKGDVAIGISNHSVTSILQEISAEAARNKKATTKRTSIGHYSTNYNKVLNAIAANRKSSHCRRQLQLEEELRQNHSRANSTVGSMKPAAIGTGGVGTVSYKYDHLLVQQDGLLETLRHTLSDYPTGEHSDSILEVLAKNVHMSVIVDKAMRLQAGTELFTVIVGPKVKVWKPLGKATLLDPFNGYAEIVDESSNSSSNTNNSSSHGGGSISSNNNTNTSAGCIIAAEVAETSKATSIKSSNVPTGVRSRMNSISSYNANDFSRMSDTVEFADGEDIDEEEEEEEDALESARIPAHLKASSTDTLSVASLITTPVLNNTSNMRKISYNASSNNSVNGSSGSNNNSSTNNNSLLAASAAGITLDISNNGNKSNSNRDEKRDDITSTPPKLSKENIASNTTPSSGSGNNNSYNGGSSSSSKGCPILVQTAPGIKMLTQVANADVNISLPGLMRFLLAHFRDVPLLKEYLEILLGGAFHCDQLYILNMLLQKLSKYLLLPGIQLDVNINFRIVSFDNEIMVRIETPEQHDAGVDLLTTNTNNNASNRVTPVTTPMKSTRTNSFAVNNNDTPSEGVAADNVNTSSSPDNKLFDEDINNKEKGSRPPLHYYDNNNHKSSHNNAVTLNMEISATDLFEDIRDMCSQFKVFVVNGANLRNAAK